MQMTYISDMYPRSTIVGIPVKYERDIQNATTVFGYSEKRETYGNGCKRFSGTLPCNKEYSQLACKGVSGPCWKDVQNINVD